MKTNEASKAKQPKQFGREKMFNILSASVAFI